MDNRDPRIDRSDPVQAAAEDRYNNSNNRDILNDIADLLDGREWNVGDLETIADLVRQSGREIGPPVADDAQLTTYVVEYEQTEYRKLTVEALDEAHVRRLWESGDIWMMDTDDEYLDFEGRVLGEIREW